MRKDHCDLIEILNISSSHWASVLIKLIKGRWGRLSQVRVDHCDLVEILEISCSLWACVLIKWIKGRSGRSSLVC